MALFDWWSKKGENKAKQAIYEYSIHDGNQNIMPDNAEQYIKRGYSGNTTVYSVISKIDNMSKQAKLVLKDKSGNVVENHELTKFLTKVNKDLSFNDFKTACLVYRLTIGEHFVYKLAPTAGLNKGKVSELHVLPAAQTEIIEGNWLEPVRGYKIGGNYNVEMTKDEVYHSKLFNPNYMTDGSLHGMSPLRAAANTVSKLNQIEITETKVFENQGPKYILFKKTNDLSQRLTDPQQADLTAQVKNAGKAANRGLPLILKEEFGKLDLGQKLADMEVIESSNSGIIALCGVYGFPPELLGYGQKTYNNMKEARKAAWTDCIMPNLDAISTTLNECLIEPVSEYKGLRFDFDYSEVEELQEGMETKVQWMIQAGWSGNDILEATGKTKVDNPLMDEPRIPMGVSFISDYSEPLDEGAKDYGDYLGKK